MSPAASSVPGFRPGENAGRTVEEENARVLNLEIPLWIQSNVRKAAASSMGSSVASSYEDPADCILDGDDDGNPTPRDREIPKVLPVLASVLERLVTRNEQFANSPAAGVFNPKKLTIFHGLKAPGISIAKYLERIFKYTSCSPSCFVVGYVFIDRLIHRQPDLLLTSLNVHRLLVTSVMVATKMLDDVHFNNAFFARVGGVSVVELNQLEIEFLFRLDFQLSVTISVFENYCSHLEKEVRTLGKKSQRIEQSLPAFGSPSTTEAAEMTSSSWKKRVAAAVHKSRLNSSQLAAQYEQSIAKMISRQSSFQSL